MTTWSEAATRARRRLMYERAQRTLRDLGLHDLADQTRAEQDKEERLARTTVWVVPADPDRLARLREAAEG